MMQRLKPTFDVRCFTSNFSNLLEEAPECQKGGWSIEKDGAAAVPTSFSMLANTAIQRAQNKAEGNHGSQRF